MLEEDLEINEVKSNGNTEARTAKFRAVDKACKVASDRPSTPGTTHKGVN